MDGTDVLPQSEVGPEQLLEILLESLMRILQRGGFEGRDVADKLLEVGAKVGAPVSHDDVTRVSLGADQRICMELMCLWRREPEFCDRRGLPAPLPVRGARPSFEMLVKRVNEHLSIDRILALLVSFRAVYLDRNGCVVAATPTFILSSHDSDRALAIDGVLKQLIGYVSVVEHNVFSVKPFTPPRFERSCSVVLPRKMVPVAQRFVRERGQDFVDSVDEWLIRQSIATKSMPGPHVELGAGAYFLHLGAVELDKTIS